MTNPLPLIPLVIVHGTLGSGKTTVVRELLKTPALRGAFIIENEFAHESIDGMALGDEVHEDQLAELSGGCVCCLKRKILIVNCLK
jgi:G3E family GTPase